MGYQVLARKWRPHTFHQVVGQQHVLTALINALEQGRLHHAYLFSGTRGVGKTTIARILAKCLNCEQGVTSTPCGQCDSCKEIDRGNFVDLLEIDAASRTKVEDTRELLDNVQYRPARGRYKVYLIDEVHMLSRHSFNALLKTLEEPPPYVKFLLATTDPQKLPVTILSRCLQFHLKALNREQIIEQLARVLDAEGQAYEPPALMALAKAADGSMRDALSLTDQALAHGNGHVHLSQVLAMLGTLDHGHLHQMLRLLQQQKGPELMAKVAEVTQLGPDFELLHAELASLLHRMAMTQLLGRGLDPLALDNEPLQELARLFTAEEIQLYYQIALTGRKELPYAPDGRSGLEMTLLRMLAFSPRRTPVAAQLTPTSRPAGSEPMALSAQGGAQAAASSAAFPPSEVKGSLSPSPTAPTERYAASASQSEDRPSPEAEALFAEQRTLLEHAAVLGHGHLREAEPHVQQTRPDVAHSPQGGDTETQLQGLDQGSVAASPASGISQLLQVRNRLRSQQKVDPVAEPVVREPVRTLRPPVATQGSNHGGEQMAATVVAPSTARAIPPSVETVNDVLPPPAYAMDDMPPWELPPVEAYQNEWEGGLMGGGNETAAPVISAAPSPTAAAPGLVNVADAVEARPVATLPSNLVSTAPLVSASQSLPDTDARWNSNDLLLGCGDAWGELIAQCHLGGRLRQLALHSTRQIDGARWVLTLPTEQRHLLSEKAVQTLAETFSAHLQQEVQVAVELGVPGLTPAQLEQQRYAQLCEAAEQALAQDPHIQFLIQRFGAQLDADSILPLKH